MVSAMAWPRHHTAGDVDAALESLPEGWLVTPVGPAHLVLGPNGAQVVAVDDGSDSAAHDLARLAGAVRAALAERVALMPFVHALLVTDRRDPCPPATRIPPSSLALALVDGPPTLGPDDLARLRQAVAEGVLRGVAALTAGPDRLSRPA